MQSTNVELHRVEALYKANNAQASDVERRRLENGQAHVRLEQIKTLLDLYRAAGKTEAKEKSEAAPPAEAKQPAESPPSESGAGRGIEWQRDLAAAQQLAVASNRLVLMQITAPWSQWCKPLEKNVFGHDDVIRAIEAHYVPVRIDYDLHRSLAKQYGVKGVPWTVIINPGGELIDEFNTHQKAEAYVDRIEKIASSASMASRSDGQN